MNPSLKGKNESPTVVIPEVELNDRGMRIIGIPFFGIAIPNVSGLFGTLSYGDLVYWLGYVYFILLAFLIWEGNRYLLFKTRKRFTWFDHPIEKIIRLVINNIFYTAPLTIVMLSGWYFWAGFTTPHWNTIKVVTLINVICVLFVTHIYETLFMMKEQRKEYLRNAHLMRAKAEAELNALKNQIDPHFMFNSLNSLSHLVITDAKKATLFIEYLAEIYRYILTQKEQSLITLKEEFEFMNTYSNLLFIRFGKAFSIDTELQQDISQFLIPPLSGFVALENAFKHNEISETMPLTITIIVHENKLTITNNIQKKKSLVASSNIGLKNLNERFQIITGLPIHSAETNHCFEVVLPLVLQNTRRS